VFLSDSMVERACSEYGINPNNTFVAYPFKTINSPKPANNLSDIFHPDFKHIVYSGALGEKQCPEQLLDLFLSVIRQRNDVQCHIFSRGPVFSRLQGAVGSENGKRIQFHDLVAEADLPELYRNSAIQIIPQAKGTSDGAIPSKLPNILSAGCPVFCIADAGSELHKILSIANGHTLVGDLADSWHRGHLVDQLLAFMDETRHVSNSQRQALIEPFVNAHFSIHRLVTHIVS